MNLYTLRVAEPCAENWDTMPGDARARHCDRCRLHVLNLSELTRDEAEAALSQRTPGGRLCVRYTLDARGKVVTRTSERARLVDLLRAMQSGGAP